jgi:wyosine [tRNA(Phe)-imidazoG37] synthetase (radical SAM superfamily)
MSVQLLIHKFGKKQLQGKYCLTPFNSVHIAFNGDVRMCLCPAWQTIPIGNILQHNLDTLLNSSLARQVRQSIIDGTYDFCNEKQCPILINDQLNTIDTVPDNIRYQIEDNTRYGMPYEIVLTGDLTCNLSCPSCRKAVIKLDESQRQQQQDIANTLYNNIFSKPTDQHIRFMPGAAGEIFSSAMMLGMLSKLNLQDFPNIKITLHTNGLLVEKNWDKIAHLASAIDNITISIDACTAPTYESVRRGGKWPALLSALDFISSKKQQFGFDWHARMIVQKENYQEIPEFYNFCKSYNIDRIEYSRLLDWRSWSREEFLKNDVLDINHPNRVKALEKIQSIQALPGTWIEGDFN